MKEEIAELQSETTASLDRAIAAAQAATSVGSHVAEELQEQREQMGHIESDARGINADLKRTNYNLKYGFTWRGALAAPFRRSSKKPPGVAAGIKKTGDDISPVFKDDYQKSPAKTAPAHGEGIAANSRKTNGGLFGSMSPRRNKNGAGTAEGSNGNGSNTSPKLLQEHVPEGFEKQLDDIDGLLDGLAAQAKAIGTELKQQNEGIEVLGAQVEPARVEAESQAKQIKRRFRVRG